MLHFIACFLNDNVKHLTQLQTFLFYKAKALRALYLFEVSHNDLQEFALNNQAFS